MGNEKTAYVQSLEEKVKELTLKLENKNVVTVEITNIPKEKKVKKHAVQ